MNESDGAMPACHSSGCLPIVGPRATSRDVEIIEQIAAKAKELGFDRVGVVPVAESTTVDAFDDWLAEGRHGSMDYLEKWYDIRVGRGTLEPGLKSVIVLLSNYHRASDRTAGGWRVARYALGDDYHEHLRERMREIASFIHAETGASVASRPAIDSAPVMERDLAMRAGLGWVGKNTMLIDPEIGSYTFVGELFVDIDLGGSETRLPDRCGTCTACIDACPTGAIISPYVLDARKCISYLTIELRGPIPREMRPLIGDHLFGCDICQEVCPWNRKAPEATDDTFAKRPWYDLFTLRDLIRFPHSWYIEVFRGSAMKRAKYRGLLRNAAVVMGNRADPDDLDVLSQVLAESPEPLVRGHVAWAIGQLPTADAADALREAVRRESDEYVVDEIEWALAHLAGDFEPAT